MAGTYFNYTGTNPGRPLAREATVGYGDQVLQNVRFGNELNPYKQGLTRQFLMNLNPANIQARIDALYRRNRANAAQQRQMDAVQEGFGQTAVPSLATYNAQADRNTATEGQRMRSGRGMADAYGSSLGLINAMQDPSSIMALSALQGQMQQSNMQKTPSNSLGSALFGTLGQLSGAGAFNSLFNRGSGKMYEGGGWSS